MMTTNQNRFFGLVLSGGGMRGVAHVGAIKALEEAGISPTYISGSSVGAVVGAMYAAGHSWQKMLDFFHNTSIFSPRNYAVGKAGMLDTNKYEPLLKSYFPDNNFEALGKNLFVTAANMMEGKTEIFSSGELIPALLASAAMPGVFSPVRINGVLYSDGGIINNFPVESVADLCDLVIGVTVNPIGKVKASDLRSSYAILQRAVLMDRANASTMKFDRCDVIIDPQKLTEFGMFSSSHIDEIFEIGYEDAKRVIEDKKDVLFPKGILA